MSKFNKKQVLKPNKLFVKTGDMVKIRSGNDKGKTGKIIAVNSKKRMVQVEGIAMTTKHIKKNEQTGESGSIKKFERFIHSCKVSLVKNDHKGDKK